MDDHSTNRIASVYLAFAEREAHGRSALYETLARGVADDSVARFFLAELHERNSNPTCYLRRCDISTGRPGIGVISGGCL
jgi:hypothetical protein